MIGQTQGFEKQTIALAHARTHKLHNDLCSCTCLCTGGKKPHRSTNPSIIVFLFVDVFYHWVVYNKTFFLNKVVVLWMSCKGKTVTVYIHRNNASWCFSGKDTILGIYTTVFKWLSHYQWFLMLILSVHFTLAPPQTLSFCGGALHCSFVILFSKFFKAW